MTLRQREFTIEQFSLLLKRGHLDAIGTSLGFRLSIRFRLRRSLCRFVGKQDRLKRDI